MSCQDDCVHIAAKKAPRITNVVHPGSFVWAAAALAMVIYAMALPERYDVACGAFAFTLIVTLAVSGDPIPLLDSRAWETFLGGVARPGHRDASLAASHAKHREKPRTRAV
jgi:NO-binding membrane sensor protein with MHYT domain